MKYRLFDGGYESFPDDRVPEEYRNIVIDELPKEIIDAEKERMSARPKTEMEIEELKARIEALEESLARG